MHGFRRRSEIFGLRHDDVKPAFEASVDQADARRDTAIGYDSSFTFWSPDTQ